MGEIMDSSDVLGAMGGFMIGQMFARQTQEKPSVLHYVSIRVDDSDGEALLISLNDIMREVFLNLPTDIGIDFEYTNKAELKVWATKNNRRIGQPTFTFLLCGHSWTKKDQFFTIGLRNEYGAPIEFNIALFRHILLKLDEKKVKYELW